jgi:hypothetical protein
MPCESLLEAKVRVLSSVSPPYSTGMGPARRFDSRSIVSNKIRLLISMGNVPVSEQNNASNLVKVLSCPRVAGRLDPRLLFPATLMILTFGRLNESGKESEKELRPRKTNWRDGIC